MNPIEAFQRIINGVPIGDHACDEEGLVCEGCGVPSSSNMLHKPLTNLDLPNASRPPLLLLECETSYCDGVPSSTVKFADIDAYDFSLPGDGHTPHAAISSLRSSKAMVLILLLMCVEMVRAGQ